MGDNAATPSKPGPVHVQFLKMDPALIDQRVNLPTVEPNTYILIDNDAQNCGVIQEDEFTASFVDRNIKTYILDGGESWPEVPDPDKHNVILTYSSGTKATILVGSISLDDGPAPDQYAKSGGVIYPIDQSGALLLDATNTPGLSYIRQHYWDLAGQETASNLMFAEMVYFFAGPGGAVTALGHAAESSNYTTGEEVVAPPLPEIKTGEDSPKDDGDQGN